MRGNQLDIVISCYNPDSNWHQVLADRIVSYRTELSHHNLSFILVNDGSTNDISTELEWLKLSRGIKVFSYEQNMGKGHAIRYGVSQSTSDWVCYSDIDLPYTAKSLDAMIKKAETKQYNVIIGKRTEKYFKGIPLQRKLISKGLILINSFLLRLSNPDTQCGIKMIDAEVKELFLNGKVNGFLFEIEFLKKAEKDFMVASEEVSLDDHVKLSTVGIGKLLTLTKEYFAIKKASSK